MQSLSQKNIEYLEPSQNFISFPGLLFVLALHGALLFVLWNQRLIPPPEQIVTLFADILTIPVPETAPKAKPEPPPVKLQPIKKPKPKPKQRRLTAKPPVLPKQEFVAPPPEAETEVDLEPEPVIEAPPPAQIQTGPVMLSSELSVSCPKLTAPAYPSLSRRMGEEGKLVLRVELDETGRVDEARVVNSSGFTRLDNAALAAVKVWQCKPSLRNGQPVRAVALQPFNFVLQGN
tara:strand:- start:632 stop:1330 length:699 start_codon:yes stop_codon:yes gene_type:complete